MHETMGFTPAGVWRSAGHKLDQWHDVGVWQLQLQPPQDPPIPVRPFASLRDDEALRALLAVG
jgi:hypothetical protein